MIPLAERAYFQLCLALGRLLRSGRYARVRIIDHGRERQVRKWRLFYAPLLVWVGGPLMRILDTGVRVLPQREWEQQERRIHWSLRGTSVRVDADGMLALPFLAGETLAKVLEDSELEEPIRRKAIEQAVIALAEFHRLGFTHGDAMAENVLVDLAPRRCSGRPEHSSKGEAGVAHWFDFETVHDASRSFEWRRADDLRALLFTCLVRTIPEKRAENLQLILNVYGNEQVTRVLAANCSSVLRRPLAFHLAQAALSYQRFQEVGALLRPHLLMTTRT